MTQTYVPDMNPWVINAVIFAFVVTLGVWFSTIALAWRQIGLRLRLLLVLGAVMASAIAALYLFFLDPATADPGGGGSVSCSIREGVGAYTLAAQVGVGASETSNGAGCVRAGQNQTVLVLGLFMVSGAVLREGARWFLARPRFRE